MFYVILLQWLTSIKTQMLNNEKIIFVQTWVTAAAAVLQ